MRPSHNLVLNVTLLAAMVLGAVATMSSVYAADVGVSISVGQPGFYGRIDLGNMPQPRVIYREPIVVERVPVVAYAPAPAPLYLRVPPGHARKWSKHCYRYNACGVPVYFVHDRWYRDVYVPAYARVARGPSYGVPRYGPNTAAPIPVYAEDYSSRHRGKSRKDD